VDAGLQLRRHEVIKLPTDGDVQCHTSNHAMAGQLGPRHGFGARPKKIGWGFSVFSWLHFKLKTHKALQTQLGRLFHYQEAALAPHGLGGFAPALGQA
jgi:hypothetical protein